MRGAAPTDGGLQPRGDLGYAFRVIARATPSLRIARFFVQGFRTFRDKTMIPLSDEGGPADEVATFHGPNGSGKSNALAALDLFFRGAATWMASGANPGNRQPDQSSYPPLTRLRLPLGWADQASGFEINHRNWPAGERDPQQILVQFDSRDRDQLAITMTQTGNEVFVDFDRYVPTNRGLIPEGTKEDPSAIGIFAALKTALLSPKGSLSNPFFRLSARRSHLGTLGGGLDFGAATDSPLSLAMAARLYEFATSVEPQDTLRWRAFGDLVHQFKTLDKRELSIVLLPLSARANTPVYDIRFEIRGKQILRLSELSSGEQQVIAVCAAVLTSRAAIVAIEEPEISLHPDYQRILREILADQVKSGILDQVILESHSPMFDNGPNVVHFTRSDDELPVTRVDRKPSIQGREDVTEKAKAAGARRFWVSSEGFTQLPEEMCKQMGLDRGGGHVWFLPEQKSPAWKAWKEEDLDAVVGAGDRPED